MSTIMLKKSGKIIPLPKAIATEGRLSDCLSVKRKSEVFLLESTNQKETLILKIFYKHSFSKKKYRKIMPLSEKNLVLPKKHTEQNGIHYVLYQKYTTLKDLLTQRGISLWELFSLGIDLSDAAITLYRHQIYEADVSPNNIYRSQEGHFCLGDLNIENTRNRGTPGYLAPEISDSKHTLPSKKRFDKAMQYSICKVLDSIYQQSRTTKIEDIDRLLKKGTQEHPDNRFHSLAELRRELEQQKKRVENEHEYLLFRIKDTDQTLFHTKTIVCSSGEKMFWYPVLWGILALAGCVLLGSIYRYLHPDHYMTQNKIYLAQIAENTPTTSASLAKSSAAVKKIPANLPTVTSHDKDGNTAASEKNETAGIKTRELDVQNSGILSLSDITSQIDTKKVTCLYAGNNKITDISHIYLFPEIRELYLDSNRIEELPHIGSLKNLEILVLSYNQITRLPELSNLASLKHLDISSNPNFKDANSLKDLTALSTLNIAETGISKKQYRMLCRRLTRCRIIY